MSDKTEVLIHLTGSPTVEAIAGTTSAFQDLLDAIAQRPVPMTVRAHRVCDTCGARSEAVDLTDPTAAETTLREAGWVRDTSASTDTCPTCAGGDPA